MKETIKFIMRESRNFELDGTGKLIKVDSLEKEWLERNVNRK